MPETQTERMNRILRDHVGYTGDGQGGDGALPIGDRSTARKPIDKRDLREAFIPLAESADGLKSAVGDADESAAIAIAKAADATLAAKAAGAPLFATLADGEAATTDGDVFMVQAEPGTAVYERQAGSGVLLGWLGEILFEDFDALDSFDGDLGAGTTMRTRKEGYSVTVTAGANYQQLTSGGLKVNPNRAASMTPAPIKAATFEAFASSAASPVPVSSFDGSLWGYSGGRIYRQDVRGGAWVDVVATPGGASVIRLHKTDDGEVVLVTPQSIYKSSGWPSSPTWALKVTNTGGTAAFYNFSGGGNGRKFIFGEYATGAADAGWQNSQKAWASVDSGDTWSVIYDATTLHPTNDYTDSHIHGCAYDEVHDIFLVIEGHKSEGIYWSTDGTTWTKVNKGHVPNGAYPTVIVPTTHGIVLGSDSSENGMFVLDRGETPADMSLRWVWEMSVDVPQIAGFGRSYWRDDQTGIVYIGWWCDGSATVGAPVPLLITASDGVGAWAVWTGDDSTGATTISEIPNVVVAPWRELLAVTSGGAGSNIIKGDVPAPGGVDKHALDPGGVLGAKRTDVRRSLAAGRGARAGFRATALGAGANAPNEAGTAIGSAAKAGNNGVSIGTGVGDTSKTQSVIIGSGATSDSLSVAVGQIASAGLNSVAVGQAATAFSDAVAVGKSANAGNLTSTAVGRSASATGTSGTAIGRQAASGGSSSVAVGYLASAGGDVSTAVGKSASASAFGSSAFGNGATATHSYSIALGQGVSTTGFNQVAIGNRDLEVQDSTRGVILQSPNGTRHRVTVADNASLTVTAL